MTQHSMDLRSRLENFRQIICTTVCTNLQGDIIELEVGMNLAMQWLEEIRRNKAALYIVGNGGSAAVASHAQTDFINVACLKTQVLHEPAVLTCMTNDYGYENAYARMLSIMIESNDCLIAISSSGKSVNICRAVHEARARGLKIITLSGFYEDNPLRKLGDLNYWLESTDYGFVEVGHQFILHNLADRFGALKAELAREKVQNHYVTAN